MAWGASPYFTKSPNNPFGDKSWGMALHCQAGPDMGTWLRGLPLLHEVPWHPFFGRRGGWRPPLPGRHDRGGRPLFHVVTIVALLSLGGSPYFTSSHSLSPLQETGHASHWCPLLATALGGGRRAATPPHSVHSPRLGVHYSHTSRESPQKGGGAVNLKKNRLNGVHHV